MTIQTTHNKRKREMVCCVSFLRRSVMIDDSRRLRHVKRKEKAKLLKVSYSDLSKAIRLFIAGRDPTTTLKKIVKELDRNIQAVRNGRAFVLIINHHSFLPFVYRAAWLQSLYGKTGKRNPPMARIPMNGMNILMILRPCLIIRNRW